MSLRERSVQGIVIACCLLLMPVRAWADKLQDLEQRYEDQQKSLTQLRQEMNRLRQERSTQQAETDRRVMEVEKKAAETAASSLLTGFEPGTGFYLKSADDQFRLRLQGYLQQWFIAEGSRNEAGFPAAYQSPTVLPGVKNRHIPSTFKARRIEIILRGEVFKDFDYYIELATASTGPKPGSPSGTGNGAGVVGTRIDLFWTGYTYAPWAKVKVGQIRDFFDIEMMTSSNDLDFAERAVVSRALAPDIQFGAHVSGNLNLPIMNMPFYYGVGIFNGCGRLDQCPQGIDNDGDKEFAGRFAFSPPVPVGNLTIGLNADHRSFRMVNGKGAADQNGVTTPCTTAGCNYHIFDPTQATGWKMAGDGSGPIGFNQNGFRINGNRVTGGGDLVYDFYPFVLKGEYLYASQERDALGSNGTNLDNLIMQGGFGSVGYWVFGNKRNGLLAIDRYEHLRVDDRRSKFTPAAGTSEQPMEMRSNTLGLTWYVNPVVWLRANYIMTDVRPHNNVIGISNNTRGELVHEGIAELMVKF